MKIKSLMSCNIVTVEMDDRLSTIKEIFDNTHFHHLLVVEGGKLCGVISDRDLFKSLSPNIDTIAATDKDLASLNKRAHQIMTRHPITINEGSSIKDAIELFNNNAISCIPVINSSNEPVGIISWRDIMKELGSRINKLGKQDASIIGVPS